MDIMKNKFGQISGGRILDVGTGTGNFITVFTDFFKDYTEIIGIDSSEKAIRMAQEANKNDKIKFIRMDAAHMDFNDNSMDTVCISNTLHHIQDVNIVLKEMLRVLKPGGLFIVNEMFCDNQSEKQLSHVYVHHLFGEIDTLLGNYHAPTYKKQDIIDIVKKSGIKIQDTFEYNTHDEQAISPNPEEEKETLDLTFKSAENYAEKIKDKPQYADIKKRIEGLKAKLYDIGIYGATELMILGTRGTVTEIENLHTM